ncbi:hypothetical protein D3C81_882630 [compost metagenome]
MMIIIFKIADSIKNGQSPKSSDPQFSTYIFRYTTDIIICNTMAVHRNSEKIQELKISGI